MGRLVAPLLACLLALAACGGTATSGSGVKLTVTSPADGSTVTIESILATGTAPAGASITLVTRMAPDDHTTANSAGEWAMQVMLTEGDNALTFRLGDDDSTAVTIHVTLHAKDAAAVNGSPVPVATNTIAPATASPTPSASPASTPGVTSAVSAATAAAQPAAPSPAPVAAPRPTTPPGAITVVFTGLTSPVARNADATASVRTLPTATCGITVTYKSGPFNGPGLGAKMADGSGNVSWTWTVGPRTARGSWPVTVQCSKNGASASATRYFTVV